MSDRLVVELEDLGGHLAYPAPRRPVVALESPPGWRGRAIAVAMVVAVTVAGVLAVAPVREAVARWLGLGAVTVVVTDEVASAPSVPLVGEPIGVEEAASLVGREWGLPALLGPPATAAVEVVEDVHHVTVLWSDAEGSPVLLSFVRGAVDGVIVRKALGPGATYLDVDVAGGRGFWIEGAPHTFTYLDELGRPIPSTTRLAGNVLLWERGDHTLRLEGVADLDRAIAIAESVDR